MTFDANMYGCTFTIIDVLSLPLFIFFFSGYTRFFRLHPAGVVYGLLTLIVYLCAGCYISFAYDEICMFYGIHKKHELSLLVMCLQI